MPRSPWQPAYLRIAADLRARIACGAIAPDERLPTEHELAAQYGVGRATVRQGMALLVQEGRVESRRPVGHFVRAVRRLDWPAYSFELDDRAADAWVASVQDQGYSARQDIRVEIIQPAPLVATRLGIDGTDLVVVRRRVRYVDDRPYLIADSYYPERIVGGTPIAHPTDIEEGARNVLASLGHRWTTHSDEIEGRAPTEDESRLLDIPSGLSVLVHTRTSANSAGVVSRVMISVLPVDRHRILYRVEA